MLMKRPVCFQPLHGLDPFHSTDTVPLEASTAHHQETLSYCYAITWLDVS